jgi:hypothetical protein
MTFWGAVFLLVLGAIFAALFVAEFLRAHRHEGNPNE